MTDHELTRVERAGCFFGSKVCTRTVRLLAGLARHLRQENRRLSRANAELKRRVAELEDTRHYEKTLAQIVTDCAGGAITSD